MIEDIEPVAGNSEQSGVPRSTKIALIVCGVVLLIGVGYFAFTRLTTSDPQEAATQEAQAVVAAVSKLMVLPTDETPIIATVADPTQLANQPFFQNAQKGDKVLIFNQAKKAILYSPEKNLVVDVAPLSIGSPTPSPKK
jgi:hypothetical protein